jgi:hypothetical protein
MRLGKPRCGKHLWGLLARAWDRSPAATRIPLSPLSDCVWTGCVSWVSLSQARTMGNPIACVLLETGGCPGIARPGPEKAECLWGRSGRCRSARRSGAAPVRSGPSDRNWRCRSWPVAARRWSPRVTADGSVLARARRSMPGLRWMSGSGLTTRPRAMLLDCTSLLIRWPVFSISSCHRSGRPMASTTCCLGWGVDRMTRLRPTGENAAARVTLIKRCRRQSPSSVSWLLPYMSSLGQSDDLYQPVYDGSVPCSAKVT